MAHVVHAGGGPRVVRVELPFHLRTLARVQGEVAVEVTGLVTLGAVLDALERRYPVLQGTIRDYGTLKRRAFLRFFACQDDVSLESADFVLPDPIAAGSEPLMVVGALAGG